ncbi:YncE family protein [Amycolatopsis sp. NPDC059027]|uniref:YncE family protein n=1 Tax=unclassified Amycolatopsis TaxID=2618356 RepID=UPI0036733D1A
MSRRAAVSRIAIPLAGVLVLTGCSSGKQQADSLQVVANPVAATAAPSPAVTAKPAGQVLAAPAVSAMAADASSHSLVVAFAQPPSLKIFDVGAAPVEKATIALPGPAERLTTSPGQVLASIPAKGLLARVALPSGQLTTTPITGQPAAGVADGPQTLVAVRDRKAIDVLVDGKVTKTITGDLYSADDVVPTGTGVVVLDRLRTALLSVDVGAGKLGAGLRAGDGAANAVADDYGRVLVTDARAGALLAFSADPLLLRQRYPVPGGIYGITYDGKRHLAWVTLTGRNEVVGFDVRGGEPVEKFRFPTVRQPDSVSVDDQDGRVFVGSAAGEGIQVIQP